MCSNNPINSNSDGWCSTILIIIVTKTLVMCTKFIIIVTKTLVMCTKI